MSVAITEHPAENKGGRYFKYVFIAYQQRRGEFTKCFYYLAVPIQASILGLLVFYCYLLRQFALLI